MNGRISFLYHLSNRKHIKTPEGFDDWTSFFEFGYDNPVEFNEIMVNTLKVDKYTLDMLNNAFSCSKYFEDKFIWHTEIQANKIEHDEYKPNTATSDDQSFWRDIKNRIRV